MDGLNLNLFTMHTLFIKRIKPVLCTGGHVKVVIPYNSASQWTNLFIWCCFAVNTVFWLNIARPTGVWKLHNESCRYCKPRETRNKGLNCLKKDGGWIQVESFESGYKFYESDHIDNEYWQPCRVCNPDPER